MTHYRGPQIMVAHIKKFLRVVTLYICNHMLGFYIGGGFKRVRQLV